MMEQISNTEMLPLNEVNEMWDHYLDLDESLCIFAPRRFGKTHNLVRKFINTPRSVYITDSLYSSRRVRDKCRSLGSGVRDDLDYNRDIFSYNVVYKLMGVDIDRIFIDEFCIFRMGVDRMIRDLMPRCRQLTMVSTMGSEIEYNDAMNYIKTVRLPYDWRNGTIKEKSMYICTETFW